MAKDEAKEKTLKRRNADGSVQRVVKKKPVKMNLVKPKRMETPGTDPANPSNLVFPTDRFGLTTEIRKAVISATRKVGGDKDKVALIEETLRVLRGHVQATYKSTVSRGGLKRRTLEGTTESTDTTSKEEEGTQEASTDETEVVTVKTKGGQKKRAKTTKKKATKKAKK